MGVWKNKEHRMMTHHVVVVGCMISQEIREDWTHTLVHLQRCSVCDRVKIFCTSKFSYVPFCNPTHKMWNWDKSKYVGGLLIANHLDESLWWANPKHWAGVSSHLLHSFLQVHSAAAPFTSQGNVPNYVEPKPFSWAKPANIGLFSSNFYCAGSQIKHRWRCS